MEIFSPPRSWVARSYSSSASVFAGFWTDGLTGVSDFSTVLDSHPAKRKIQAANNE